MEPFFEEIRARLEANPGRPLTLPGLSLRESAVLVPLFWRAGEAQVLFTRRPMTLRRHAGQISFPGGARDAADLTPLHTALRELHEELGVPPAKVQTLGMLDEIPTVTGFRIVPFVGVIPGDIAYVPSPDEIAEVIEVPLGKLKESDRYLYQHGRHTIWGATARILRDLLLRLGQGS